MYRRAAERGYTHTPHHCRRGGRRGEGRQPRHLYPYGHSIHICRPPWFLEGRWKSGIRAEIQAPKNGNPESGQKSGAQKVEIRNPGRNPAQKVEIRNPGRNPGPKKWKSGIRAEIRSPKKRKSGIRAEVRPKKWKSGIRAEIRSPKKRKAGIRAKIRGPKIGNPEFRQNPAQKMEIRNPETTGGADSQARRFAGSTPVHRLPIPPSCAFARPCTSMARTQQHGQPASRQRRSVESVHVRIHVAAISGIGQPTQQ